MQNVRMTGIVFAVLFTTFELLGQPSGGPYGPVRQSYALPKVTGKIMYVAIDGAADQDGESVASPTTLEAAIERARTGDAIVMRGGTYRTGGLLLNQGITIQPYKDEQPVMKGTQIASLWEDLGNGLWTTKWTHLFPQKPADWWRRNREGKITPLHRFNNDMVFVDGRFLQSAGWEGEVDESSFHIDYETGTVYIGTDPTNRVVEITAHDVAILRTTKDVRGLRSDKKGYTLRGVTLTQYAYRALEIEGTDAEGLSQESHHGKDVVGTTIEHCTISYCSRVAGYFRGDNMTIRHCRISDTSTEGVYVLSSNDVLLEKNIFTRNNIEQITGYYPAAVKIFNQCYRVTCNDNLVIDHPYSNGIWYDVGNVDGVFTNNWIENVGGRFQYMRTDQVWPSDNGFFFEISKGALCVGNLFVNCDQGLLVLNASDVHVYNNTFINSVATFARNTRVAQGDHFGWHASTGPDIDKRDGHIFVNNLLVSGERFRRPLFYTWQPPVLCAQLADPLLKQMNNNAYVRSGASSATALMLWSPSAADNCQEWFTTLDAFRKRYQNFDAQSIELTSYDGPLFKGLEAGQYQILAAFRGSKIAGTIPDRARELMTHRTSKGGFVGAYPSVP